MMTKQFLDDLVSGLPEITDTCRQVVEADGLDAVLTLMTSIRSIEFPALILESKAEGYFTVAEGALDFYTQHLWIMESVPADESEVSKAVVAGTAFTLMKKVVALLIAAWSAGKLPGLERNRMGYRLRGGGGNAYGYELTLSFREDVSLLPEDE